MQTQGSCRASLPGKTARQAGSLAAGNPGSVAAATHEIEQRVRRVTWRPDATARWTFRMAIERRSAFRFPVLLAHEQLDLSDEGVRIDRLGEVRGKTPIAAQFDTSGRV